MLSRQSRPHSANSNCNKINELRMMNSLASHQSRTNLGVFRKSLGLFTSWDNHFPIVFSGRQQPPVVGAG